MRLGSFFRALSVFFFLCHSCAAGGNELALFPGPMDAKELFAQDLPVDSLTLLPMSKVLDVVRLVKKEHDDFGSDDSVEAGLALDQILDFLKGIAAKQNDLQQHPEWFALWASGCSHLRERMLTGELCSQPVAPKSFLVQPKSVIWRGNFAGNADSEELQEGGLLSQMLSGEFVVAVSKRAKENYYWDQNQGEKKSEIFYEGSNLPLKEEEEEGLKRIPYRGVFLVVDQQKLEECRREIIRTLSFDDSESNIFVGIKDMVRKGFRDAVASAREMVAVLETVKNLKDTGLDKVLADKVRTKKIRPGGGGEPAV